MPQGQAHTVWFPDLTFLLKEKWTIDLSIPDQFVLVSDLNHLLDKIRAGYNIKPPMMWCPKCQKRERSRFTPISITSMYYTLKRFNICSEIEFKALMKDWKQYSNSEGIDIYGKEQNNEHEA